MRYFISPSKLEDVPIFYDRLFHQQHQNEIIYYKVFFESPNCFLQCFFCVPLCVKSNDIIFQQPVFF